MDNKFNNIKTFQHDMIEILSKLIEDKLKQTIEFSIQTNNAQPLNELLIILDKFKF